MDTEIVLSFIKENETLFVVMMVVIFAYPIFKLTLRRISDELPFGVLSTFLRLFFYDESYTSNRKVKEMAHDLEERFKKPENDFLKRSFKDSENFISENIEKYVDANLEELIKSKLNDGAVIENTVIGNINDNVKSSFTQYLSEIDITTILEEKHKSLKIDRLINSITQLDETIQQERVSSGRLKTIMINLFVIFNIGIIISYITWGGTLISDKAIYAISGLYLSLAMFIFYIIRTSHFRTGVLLSITEDNKKHLDVLDFLNSRNNKNITEQDVELIKLFLINRAEREHKANHPYEVILKGVSGSNIQFKGGKMALGKAK